VIKKLGVVLLLALSGCVTLKEPQIEQPYVGVYDGQKQILAVEQKTGIVHWLARKDYVARHLIKLLAESYSENAKLKAQLSETPKSKSKLGKAKN
jgi:hypothetical protein